MFRSDISSVCAFKRAGALETLLNRRDLHARFVDGTDYPFVSNDSGAGSEERGEFNARARWSDSI